MKYKEMLNCPVDELQEHYAGCRNLAHNNANMAQHGKHTANKLLNDMGFLMRQISMMENAARKRKVALA